MEIIAFCFRVIKCHNLIHCVSDCRGETKLSAFEGDIRDCDFLRKACRGASTVFHIASIIDVTDSVEYSEMFGVNVKGKAATSIHFNLISCLVGHKLFSAQFHFIHKCCISAVQIDIPDKVILE